MSDALAILGPDAVEELFEHYRRSETAEEFVNAILVGPCPKCDSVNTSDCENDPEVENLCIGRCYDCGHYWCTDCGKDLDPKEPTCLCLGMCDDEDE